MALTKITNSLVAVNAIQGTLIADNAITAVHIVNNAITATQLADNAVTATKIQNGIIATDHLAADLITAAKIADDAISEEHLDSTVISSLSTVTANSSDYVMLGDTSDSNNLKKVLVSDLQQTDEEIADIVGAMVSSNTESGITVAYEDGDNTLDFTVGTLNQDTTGTADNITITANNSTDETVYPIFVDGTSGSQGGESDSGLTYNPSSGLLTTTLLAGTLNTAAQTNITSLGTLTTLTVDNVIINGTTIGHTGDTDLLTFASGALTVAGTTTIDVSSAAALILNSTADTPYMRFDHSDASKFTIGESSIVGGGGAGYYDFYAVSGIGQRFFTAAAERIRIGTAGQIGIGGANYGSDGQVLTSAGSGATVAWEDAGGGTDPDGAQTFNESGASVDFRVESNNQSHMFFVDGSADAIGIGTNTPAHMLNLVSSGDAGIHIFADSDNSGEGDNPYLSMSQDGSTAQQFKMGLIGNAGDEFTNSLANSSYIHADNDASQPLLLAHDNALVMTIRSGKVGIGTSNPGARLHVDGMVAGEMAFYIEEHRNDVISGDAALCFIDVTDQYAPFAGFKIAHAGTGSALDVQGITTIKNKAGAVQVLTGHGASSTSTAAHFQVPDNGNIGFGRRPQYYGSNKYMDIGPASTNGACIVQLLGHNSAIKLNLVADTTKGFVYTESNSDLALGRNQTAYFTINSSGVMAGDFNDTSDINLKENIQSITASTAIIKQLRPVTFDWKQITHKNNKDEDVVVSARRNKAGFIAQEVEIISGLEHAVTGTDYVDGTDIVESKSLDTLTILAHAIKTIQELEARITTLEG